MSDAVCFDLEGPLSPQDNAYDLMKLFPYGDTIFQLISRYDDILTLEARPFYEPGDTLVLIAPFLIYHNITEQEIIKLANKATLTTGALEIISLLNENDWNVFCISTSYSQYATKITERLKIPLANVASTTFPLDEYDKTLRKDYFSYVENFERIIMDNNPVDDTWIKENFDRFYFEELPLTSIRIVFERVKPTGGQRKINALQIFAEREAKPLSDWIVIGDSITDFKMLQIVSESEGISIAFNANEYALPYATMSLASTDIKDLWPVFQAWKKGKYAAVKDLVSKKQKIGGHDNLSYFHWLDGENSNDPLEIHRKIRRLVRADAAKLG